MKRIFSILILLVCVPFGTGPLLAMDISGVVKSVSTEKASDSTGVAVISPASEVAVKAMTLKNIQVAEGKTDEKGVYKITIPADREKETLVLSAETPGGAIRTLLLDKTNDIDSVTEALTRGILTANNADNYTSNEFKRMLVSLRELYNQQEYFEFQTSLGIANYLINIPEFNMLLTDLVAAYGMKGDNIALVDKTSAAVKSFVNAFNANNAGMIKGSLADSSEIFIDGTTIKAPDEIVGKIGEIHQKFNEIELSAEFATVSAERDKADVTTYERIRMKHAKDAKFVVDESWIARNVLTLSNDKWAISKREMPDCVVEKAAIKPDGRIDDWIGIRPCYYRKPGIASEDAITALFFARDDAFLYWRMDLNMEIRIPLSSEKPRLGVPRGEYYLHFYDDEDYQECDNVINVVTSELTSAASVIRVCAKDEQGVEKDSFHTHQQFAVGGKYIEGSVPLEDLFFIDDEIFCFAKAKRRERAGGPAEPFITSSRVKLLFK